MKYDPTTQTFHLPAPTTELTRELIESATALLLPVENPDTMGFSDALRYLKNQRAVGRRSWSKGVFIAIMPEIHLQSEQVNVRTKTFIPDGPIHVQRYLVQFKVSDTGVEWSSGVLITLEDLLAEDWYPRPVS